MSAVQEHTHTCAHTHKLFACLKFLLYFLLFVFSSSKRKKKSITLKSDCWWSRPSMMTTVDEEQLQILSLNSCSNVVFYSTLNVNHLHVLRERPQEHRDLRLGSSRPFFLWATEHRKLSCSSAAAWSAEPEPNHMKALYQHLTRWSIGFNFLSEKPHFNRRGHHNQHILFAGL